MSWSNTNRIVTPLKAYNVNTTPGENTNKTGFWRRIGSNLEIFGRVVWTGNPGSGVLRVEIPDASDGFLSTEVMDTSQIVAPDNFIDSTTILGEAYCYYGTGGTCHKGTIFYNNTVGFRFTFDQIENSAFNPSSVLVSGDSVAWHAVVPIVGWS